MSRKEKFLLHDYIITADDGSYLVEVESNREDVGTDRLEDLPSWVFQSRYAIWLTTGDAPIRVRAMEGEQIKQRLIRQHAIT
jgi:hypothetical protein